MTKFENINKNSDRKLDLSLLYERRFDKQGGNKLLFIFQSLIFSLIFLCKISYLQIIKYINHEQFFFNELNKKVKLLTKPNSIIHMWMRLLRWMSI